MLRETHSPKDTPSQVKSIILPPEMILLHLEQQQDGALTHSSRWSWSQPGACTEGNFCSFLGLTGRKHNLTLLKPEKVSEDPCDSLQALRSLPRLPTEAIQQLFSTWGKIGGTGNNCGLLRGEVGSAGVNPSLISCVWDGGAVMCKL